MVRDKERGDGPTTTDGIITSKNIKVVGATVSQERVVENPVLLPDLTIREA